MIELIIYGIAGITYLSYWQPISAGEFYECTLSFSTMVFRAGMVEDMVNDGFCALIAVPLNVESLHVRVA